MQHSYDFPSSWTNIWSTKSLLAFERPRSYFNFKSFERKWKLFRDLRKAKTIFQLQKMKGLSLDYERRWKIFPERERERAQLLDLGKLQPKVPTLNIHFLSFQSHVFLKEELISNLDDSSTYFYRHKNDPY